MYMYVKVVDQVPARKEQMRRERMSVLLCSSFRYTCRFEEAHVGASVTAL